MIKVNIFGAVQAAELEKLEERENALKTRSYGIVCHREAGLKKMRYISNEIDGIDIGQIPESGYYILDEAERAEDLARKAPLEAERDQIQAEIDAGVQELEQIKTEIAQLEAEMAPLAVLKQVQEKLDEHWPMIVATESVLKTATEVGPDMIVAFIAPLMDAFHECREKLGPQLERDRKLDAKATKADYDAFVEAGFQPEQAMELTLARVKMNTMRGLLSVASSMKK